MVPLSGTAFALLRSAPVPDKEGEWEKIRSGLQTWLETSDATNMSVKADVVERIHNCYVSGSDKLDLSGLGLTTLPDSGTLPSCVTVFLASNNCLSVVPPGFFTNYLTEINVSNNFLSGLPNLTSLNALRLLNIAHNRFAFLPQLPPGLAYLCARGNQLVSMNEMAPGTVYDMSDNPYVQEPPSFYGELSEDINTSENVHLMRLWWGWEENYPYPKEVDINRIINRVVKCLVKKSDTLNLSGFGIVSMPPAGCIPLHVENLNLSRNKLERLPPDIFLNTNLKYIDLSNNRLTSLPMLPHPGQLTGLRVNRNELTYLTAVTPTMRSLDASDNKIGIPPIFLNHLTMWDLRNNADNKWGISDYLWCRLDSSMQEDAKWSKLLEEPGGDAFARFIAAISRPRSGRTYKFSSLGSQFVSWVYELAHEPRMREAVFRAAEEARIHCGDRQGRFLNKLERARAVYNVSVQDKTRFLATARQIFRHEQLENIAYAKSMAIRESEPEFVHEVDVYLAYQHGLYRQLQLSPCLITNIRKVASYGPIPPLWVTSHDLAEAEKQILDKERAAFNVWLTMWDVCQEWLTAKLSEDQKVILQNNLRAEFIRVAASQTTPAAGRLDDQATDGTMEPETEKIARTRVYSQLVKEYWPELFAGKG